jgi:hypothetical protein
MLNTHAAWIGVVQEQAKRHLVFCKLINEKPIDPLLRCELERVARDRLEGQAIAQ